MGSDWGILKAILHEQLRNSMKKTLLTLWIIAALPVAALRKTESIAVEMKYTNNATQAKERGCKLVEGGNVTVIQGSRPSGGGALRPVVGRLPRHRHRPRLPPRWRTAVTINNDQRARDSDNPRDLEAGCAKKTMPSWSGIQRRPARRNALVAQPQRYMERTAGFQGLRGAQRGKRYCWYQRELSRFAYQLILTVSTSTAAGASQGLSRFHSLDLLSTLIAVLRADGAVQFANTALENTLGLSRRALEGADFSAFLHRPALPANRAHRGPGARLPH